MEKKNRKFILPAAAALLVIAAIIIVLVVPRGERGDSITATDESGDFVIKASDLSSDKVGFYRVSEESGIELIARLGDDGTAKVALGTCQSCNGSPGAYYTQQGDQLQCNNCGLTFPLEVIDNPGNGCHPITIDDSVITYDNGDARIDLEAISSYEVLFENVAEH